MNKKSQVIDSLNKKTTEMENLTKKIGNFRTSCKDCKFNNRCFLDSNIRMIKKRCYIDTMAEKLNINQETVVNRSNNFIKKYGIDFSMITNIEKEYWLKMSNRQRITDIKSYLEHFAQFTNVTVSNKDIKLFLALANCFFLAWRDDEYINCAECGELIKNSKQKNRRYCDKCKNKHKTFYKDKIKICIDCGCKFEALHNREVRCVDCQINANKSAAKERARRYRDRKRNDLEINS